MPKFRVAHLNEQGQDMVVVPMDPSFGQRPLDAQNAIIADLQARSAGAGLKGTVVVVWESGGRMHFIAPPAWRPFFLSLAMRDVEASINKELSW